MTGLSLAMVQTEVELGTAATRGRGRGGCGARRQGRRSSARRPHAAVASGWLQGTTAGEGRLLGTGRTWRAPRLGLAHAGAGRSGQESAPGVVIRGEARRVEVVPWGMGDADMGWHRSRE